MMLWEHMLNSLTDAYNKDHNSNNAKLMRIIARQFEDLQKTILKIELWRAIDEAQGTTLDLIGANVRQPRGKANDEVYRILIKSKIARNLSQGDINNIIHVLATSLNCEYGDIKITELYSSGGEPAAIAINKVPIHSLNAVGMTPHQFGQIVKRTAPAGIRVAVVELTGTFEFSSIPNQVETDANKGFSDINQQTGGYLGAAFSPAIDEDLPI